MGFPGTSGCPSGAGRFRRFAAGVYRIEATGGLRGCLRSSTGVSPVERLQFAGPRWPCDTWARCPCYVNRLLKHPLRGMSHSGFLCRYMARIALHAGGRNAVNPLPADRRQVLGDVRWILCPWNAVDPRGESQELGTLSNKFGRATRNTAYQNECVQDEALGDGLICSLWSHRQASLDDATRRVCGRSGFLMNKAQVVPYSASPATMWEEIASPTSLERPSAATKTNSRRDAEAQREAG
jgi:hypothetical protein